MNRFLVTYHGSGMPDDPALMEQAKAAFGNWVAGAGDAIVDPGAPVQMMTQVAAEGATEPVQIGGYSIIQADSVEDADVLHESLHLLFGHLGASFAVDAIGGEHVLGHQTPLRLGRAGPTSHPNYELASPILTRTRGEAHRRATDRRPLAMWC